MRDRKRGRLRTPDSPALNSQLIPGLSSTPLIDPIPRHEDSIPDPQWPCGADQWKAAPPAPVVPCSSVSAEGGRRPLRRWRSTHAPWRWID